MDKRRLLVKRAVLNCQRLSNRLLEDVTGKVFSPSEDFTCFDSSN